MARLPRLAALLTLAFGTACQPFHLPGGGYDDGPQIGEHGISVPVPPPSLTSAPKQTVEVEGELRETMPPTNTTVRLDVYNLAGDLLGGHNVLANADGTFLFADANAVDLDLTNNCLEVWSESSDGESMHSFFVASIADDDQSITTKQFFSGCL